MLSLRVLGAGSSEPYEWIRRAVENRRRVELMDPRTPAEPAPAAETMGRTFGDISDASLLATAGVVILLVVAVVKLRGPVLRWWRGRARRDPLVRAWRRVAMETRLDADQAEAVCRAGEARGVPPIAVLLCPSVMVEGKASKAPARSPVRAKVKSAPTKAGSPVPAAGRVKAA